MLADKHICWVLYPSRQHYIIKGSLEKIRNKIKYQQIYHTFLKSYSIQGQIVLQKDKHCLQITLLHIFLVL